MKHHLSVLWMRSPRGTTIHRKREYGAKSRTLCGLKVSKGWFHTFGGLRKCKRCAA